MTLPGLSQYQASAALHDLFKRKFSGDSTQEVEVGTSCELQAIVSTRTARATVWDPVSKK